MATITLNGHTVEPVSQLPQGSQFVENASRSNFILIQSQHHLQNEEINALKNLGVVFLDYLGHDTYICQYQPADLERIRELPFLVYANVYHQDFVINASLKEKAFGASEDEKSLVPPRLPSSVNTVPNKGKLYDIFVGLHHPIATGGVTEIRNHLADMLHVEPESIREDGHNLRMSVRSEHIPAVASVDEIRSIEEILPIEFDNFATRNDLNFEGSVPSYIGSGASWQGPYDGEGETIAIADSGFDIGSTDDAKMHPAFVGRVRNISNVQGGELSDKIGHGTHVCGCAAANGSSIVFGSIKGSAPKASLVIQSLCDASNNLQPPVLNALTTLFTGPYDNFQARIHSNSWSTNPPEPYIGLAYLDQSSKVIDQVAYEKRDLLILNSAGNLGAKSTLSTRQIGAEAAAKNCLTVGACESSKNLAAQNVPADATTHTPATVKLSYDAAAPVGDIGNVAGFSSRGPTLEGRCKPDVVAPGVAIYSARSQMPDVPLEIGQGLSPSTQWLFGSGTSMATPTVAGCAAVLRQFLQKTNTGLISAALVKALLVNNTEDLQGSAHTRGPTAIQAGPDPAQGFGRVNLATSLRNVMDLKNGGYLQRGPLKQGEVWPGRVTIQARNDPLAAIGINLPMTLKATLVYTDPPGAALVNELRLKVTAYDGTFQYANMGNPTPFGENNVQKVVWRNIPAGPTKIDVECTAIHPNASNPTNDQDFALVWYVEYGPPAREQAIWEFWNKRRPSMDAITIAYFAANP